jgi:hypothetical protein
MGESSMIKHVSFTALLISTALLGGCGDNGGGGSNSAEVRYRMQVEVETPEGVKSGSSVWSRSISKTIGPVSPYNASFKAEAVAVDLPGGRTLFMLVKGQEGMVDAYFPEYEVLVPGEGNDRVAHLSAISSSGASKVLPCTAEAYKSWPHKSHHGPLKADDYCPMLVTFKDIKDPTSVALVNRDDLSASFGAGYRLKAITVQVTEEAVTTGIQKRLGWLLDKDRKRFDPQNPPVGIPLGNYRGLFSTEISK